MRLPIGNRKIDRVIIGAMSFRKLHGLAGNVWTLWLQITSLVLDEEIGSNFTSLCLRLSKRMLGRGYPSLRRNNIKQTCTLHFISSSVEYARGAAFLPTWLDRELFYSAIDTQILKGAA